MKIKTGIIIILILATTITGKANAKETPDFSGKRITTCRISYSDLDNYVSGGRTTLEMLLSRNEEEWLSYGITSQERDLYISLSFSFESYVDYEEKISILMKAAPVTTYGKEGRAYIENFSPKELFEFLNYSMKEYELVDETDFTDFLEIYSDNIELNGETYSGTDILPQSDAKEIFFDSIDIDTEKDENGSWTRTIQVDVPDGQSDIIFSELERRCEQCGVSFESGSRTGKMSFSAQSETELIEKTMTVLRTTVNIRHYRYYLENGSVRNETEENIDVKPLLGNGGEFSYRLELPETYEGLSTTFQTPAADISGNIPQTGAVKTPVSEYVRPEAGAASTAAFGAGGSETSDFAGSGSSARKNWAEERIQPRREEKVDSRAVLKKMERAGAAITRDVSADDAMEEAAALLCGTHDFRAFSSYRRGKNLR